MSRTPESKFITAVRSGAKAGKTQDQIGASLGITGSAVSQRCRRLRSQGKRIPTFKSGRFDASRQIDRIGFRHPRGHLTIVEQNGKKCLAVCDCDEGGPLEYFTRNIVTGSTIRCKRCRPKPMTAVQHKIKQREWSKKWADKNPDKVAAKQKRFKDNNPGYHREWYSRNAARAVASVSAYNKRNRPKINAYERKKRKEDPQFRMAKVLRGRIRSAVKRFVKDGRVTGVSAVRHLGCSLAAFVRHLESRFTTGMSWKNHGNGRGKWNVEHIYPVSAADMSDPIQVRAVFNWRNQIPMWDSENKSKKHRVTDEAKRLFHRLVRKVEATMAQERA
jgi:hypothetical protein